MSSVYIEKAKKLDELNNFENVAESLKSLFSQDRTTNRIIEITVKTIENVTMKEDIDIIFSIEHNDVVLGESDHVTIEADIKEPPRVYDIDFTVSITVSIDDHKNINLLVSTPVLIKILRRRMTRIISTNISPDIAIKKTRKGTILSDASSMLGICNLDLFPILLGENSFMEKLIIEASYFSFDSSATSWPNLPLLLVTVTQNESTFFPPSMTTNFVNITVESIYNPPSFFAETFEYKAGTILYINNEGSESIIYSGGKWTKLRDVERTKRWNSLYNFQNRARLSKYKLNYGFSDIKNTLAEEINMEKKVLEDVPRIEWNNVDRRMLLSSGIEKMRDHINKYRNWPCQFMITDQLMESVKMKSKDNSLSKCQLYQCYVDVTELLVPGQTKTRVMAQLYTHSLPDLQEKSGLEDSIFLCNTQTKEKSEKDKKGKELPKSATLLEMETPASVPLIAENGEPVFVIIEIVLHYPLIDSRIGADYTKLINEMIISKNDIPYYPYTSDIAENQYSNCVQKLVHIITESYRDFCEEKKCSSTNADDVTSSLNDEIQQTKHYLPEKDELTCFTQYLYQTGVYFTIRQTLKSRIIILLDKKFKMESYRTDSYEGQNLIASAYTYLVEQMQIAINETIEGRLPKDLIASINSEKFYLYADEAYELGYIDNAKYYLTNAILLNKNDPHAWIQYAIFLLKIGDIDRAKECCREAIILDNQYTRALILYAAILMEERNYREAEIFFKAITDLHPRFAEGWTLLHLFYIAIQYYSGVDVTLRIAKKCIKDKDRESHAEEREPIAWTMIHCPRDNVYTMTATLLLKLNLCNLAGIALAQEMSISGRSTHVLYYMSVQHYLLARYEDALSHLKEVKCKYGMDYSISSLMGHCYFHEGNIKDAMYCYIFASTVFNRPNDLHLVELRMGFHYIDTEEYEQAKKVFLSACKSSPTSQTWLGVGITFYRLAQFEEAETALAEANNLDNHNPNIWGYLCLLNMSLERYDEFIQCYEQTVKNKLNNVKLWLTITTFMETLGYTAPTLLTELNETVLMGDNENNKNLNENDKAGI